MGDDRKTDSIYIYMYKNPADIFIFLEIRTSPEDTTRLQKKWKGACVFNNLRTNARGIAVFFKDSIATKNIKIKNILPGNLSNITFTEFEKKYLITALYGPNR